jgi:hypothetical protein
VDSRAVTREIRRVVWPALRGEGFETFTGRTAWRYADDAVDVVNFQSFSASLADAVEDVPFAVELRNGGPGVTVSGRDCSGCAVVGAFSAEAPGCQRRSSIT